MIPLGPAGVNLPGVTIALLCLVSSFTETSAQYRSVFGGCGRYHATKHAQAEMN